MRVIRMELLPIKVSQGCYVVWKNEAVKFGAKCDTIYRI